MKCTAFSLSTILLCLVALTTAVPTAVTSTDIELLARAAEANPSFWSAVTNDVKKVVGAVREGFDWSIDGCQVVKCATALSPAVIDCVMAAVTEGEDASADLSCISDVSHNPPLPSNPMLALLSSTDSRNFDTVIDNFTQAIQDVKSPPAACKGCAAAIKKHM